MPDLWRADKQEVADTIKQKCPNAATVTLLPLLSGLWGEANVTYTNGRRELVKFNDSFKIYERIPR